MDVVLTTRMWHMLALTNGVLAVVIDPVSGGAKIRRQAATGLAGHLLPSRT
jgi:hypothetical protein